ncbi:MAG: cupin domain-containing protein [Thermoleophilia bacterium]
MRIAKNDIPAKIDVPGAKARQLADFGSAEGVLAAEYFSLASGVDIAPLLQGLEHDACQAPHWGYMIEGEVTVSYVDGTVERCSAGDVFHWPPGHSVRVERDAEVILFSPADAHTEVIDHMLARMAAG